MQLSGCEDGTILLWDIPAKRSLYRLVGHTSESRLLLCYGNTVRSPTQSLCPVRVPFHSQAHAILRLALSADRVSGLAVPPTGDACISCSTDCSARLYRIAVAPLEAGLPEKELSAVLEFHGKFGFRGIDHRWQGDTFATAGEKARHLFNSMWCLPKYFSLSEICV